MPTVRDVLNELKWHHGNLEDARVHYVHRGAPGDARAVSGATIVALHHSFMELPRATMIPYHRIFRVDVAGTTVWERQST